MRNPGYGCEGSHSACADMVLDCEEVWKRVWSDGLRAGSNWEEEKGRYVMTLVVTKGFAETMEIPRERYFPTGNEVGGGLCDSFPALTRSS